MQTSKIKSLVILATALAMACNKEGVGPQGNIYNNDSKKGSLAMSVTDAPIDQTNINGAFVTITEIKVDGTVFQGFKGPKTVNLLELQNGNSLNIGQDNVAIGNYSTVTIVLDAEKDASGNAPGCFLTMTNGVKEKLEISGNGKTELELKPKNMVISENNTTEIVFDFDLRKAIKSKNNDYSFVTLGEFKSAVRAENRSITGVIKGKIDNYSSLNSNLVVYAYKKGTFNGNTEIKGQGSSEIKFANAETSCKTDGNGNFTLAFLSEGEYEVYFEKPDSNGGLGLGINTLLEANSSTNLKAVTVGAGAQANISVNIKIGGILGL